MGFFNGRVAILFWLCWLFLLILVIFVDFQICLFILIGIRIYILIRIVSCATNTKFFEQLIPLHSLLGFVLKHPFKFILGYV